MYICICNALTDKRLTQAVTDGNRRVGDIYAACGCRAQCGKCTQAIVRLLREHMPQPNEEPLTAPA